MARPHLQTYLRKQKDVVALYLFGSHAKKKNGPFSDIDLAVQLDEKTSPTRNLDIRLKLIRDLARYFPRKTLDLSILNESPLLLRYEVLRDGNLLYSRSNAKREAFSVDSILKYLDWDYYQSRLANGVIKRNTMSTLRG